MYHSLIILLAASLFGCTHKKRNTAPSLMEQQKEEHDVFWIPYSAYALQEYKERPKLIYVTADWCLTCVQLERDILLDSSIQQYLTKDDFVALRADWTQHNPEVSSLMEQYDTRILPFLVVKKQGKADVVLSHTVRKKELERLLAD
jgi:thioredoxin:protein disulfide reductase